MKLLTNNLSKTYRNGVKALDRINLEIGTGMFGYEAWSNDWQASSEAIELWGNLAQKTRFRPELSTKL